MMAFTHGTNYGYNARHCRCDDCRAWEAARLRAYRAARAARDPDFYRDRHARARASAARRRGERRSRFL